jgi:hypothetical protein
MLQIYAFYDKRTISVLLAVEISNHSNQCVHVIIKAESCSVINQQQNVNIIIFVLPSTGDMEVNWSNVSIKC